MAGEDHSGKREKRSIRPRDAAAAMGGLVAGAFAERERLGDLLDRSSESGAMPSIPDDSLDVFDDLQPPGPDAEQEDATGPDMPLLRFDTPDIPPMSEDVASSVESVEIMTIMPGEVASLGDVEPASEESTFDLEEGEQPGAIDEDDSGAPDDLL